MTDKPADQPAHLHRCLDCDQLVKDPAGHRRRTGHRMTANQRRGPGSTRYRRAKRRAAERAAARADEQASEAPPTGQPASEDDDPGALPNPATFDWHRNH